MVAQLFGHPFSSYTWKAEIALHEKDTPFEFRILDPEHPENSTELSRRSAVGKFPLLVDSDVAVFEATAIIEYLEAAHPGSIKLIPINPKAAVKVRMMDRVFDNYVMNVMTVMVGDAMRPEQHRDRPTASSAPVPVWTGSMPGSRANWGAETGRVGRTSPSPIAPPLPRCSTPIGCTRSTISMRR